MLTGECTSELTKEDNIRAKTRQDASIYRARDVGLMEGQLWWIERFVALTFAMQQADVIEQITVPELLSLSMFTTKHDGLHPG